MNPYESTYFGNVGMTRTTLKTTAVQSVNMLFITDQMIANLNAGQVQYNSTTIPLGFAQIILKLQDTPFMLTNSVEFWDRVRVTRIKFRYSPMGTESVYLNMFLTSGVQGLLHPPYSNGPLLITYDPTANVTTAAEVIAGMDRFRSQEQQPQVSTLLEGQRALRQSQHYVGETTKTFKGKILSPRAMLFSTRGPQGFTMNNEIDLGNQYRIQPGELNIPEYQHLTTYGALNFLIPRSTTGLEGTQGGTALPVIRVNVSVTYYLELYGHT